MTLKTGVIGGGAWGTALACAVHAAGNTAYIYSRRGSQSWRKGAEAAFGAKTAGLAQITASDDPAVLKDCDVILSVAKAQETRHVLAELCRDNMLPANAPVLLCSKGIEKDTGALLHEAAREACPEHPICALSGPNFAKEIAAGLPAAAVAAGDDEEAVLRCAEALRGARFRVYLSRDITGVELGGALKNVIAIACGMTEGHGLGQNARAALITRALAELSQLIVAAGGEAATLYGLSGIGDMLLTCTSPQSRNYAYGVSFAKGGDGAKEGVTAEGAETAKAVLRIAERYAVELPICTSVYRILCCGSPFAEEVRYLLDRPAGFE